jgi:zinc transport system substrate-binding protein
MKKTMLWALLAMLLLSAFPFLTAMADGKISVVSTIFPPYDFARAVAGDKAEVTMLLKPGAEIHSFEPTPADILAIQNADVFLYIGGESDVWVDKILSSMDVSKKQIVRLMDAVTLVEEKTVEGMQEEAEEAKADGEQENGEIEYDEHIWTSPKNAVLMVSAVSKAICAADAGNEAEYNKNAVDYIAQIEAVDTQFNAIVQESGTRLMVFGDRFPFRYFADAYGLEYRAAFSGCSTETEASAATIAYLIDTVQKYKLPYIYTIELSNQNIARSICEQTGAQILTLQSCQGISRDDFQAGETYVSLMRKNVENLRKGLKTP